MAAPKAECFLAVVSNIPHSFRSADLRNYFSAMVEENIFECFHFKHRPEKILLKDFDSKSNFSLDRPNVKDNVKTASIDVTTPHKHNETTCCILKITEKDYLRFKRNYHRKHWIDRLGELHSSLCMISKMKFIGEINDFDDEGGSKNMKPNQSNSSIMNQDVLKLPELNPPDIMPNGNVGTPTMVFLELIRECRIPAKVIKSLGLSFPKRRSNKRYGNVPFNYGGKVLSGKREEKVIETGTGCQIVSEGHEQNYVNNTQKKCTLSMECGEEKGKQTRDSDSEDETNSKKDTDLSEESDDSGEEWDRHETLHDDVTKQERTEERLFEEEMEIVWDKGSSGLVFYTDAAYWDALKGDFDERTSDDWNVDMSVYYEPGAGTKDAKDLLQIRKEERRRFGSTYDEPSVFTKTGTFEKHTKGIGRRVMTTMGWRDGQGLGRSSEGITEALDNDGQTSQDKRGFGYHGEKLNKKPTFCKKRRVNDVQITTVYDDIRETDPPEPLLRSNSPHHLKHNEKVE